MASMLLLGIYLVVVGVRKMWYWATWSLTENKACKTSFSMTFEDYIEKSKKCTLCDELVGDMVSHARLHIGLTISRHISYPLFPMSGHLLYLGHGKNSLEAMGLDTGSILVKVHMAL